MPLQRCQKNGRPAFRWGKTGKCYAYRESDPASRRAARERALRQARAIEASKARARASKGRGKRRR